VVEPLTTSNEARHWSKIAIFAYQPAHLMPPVRRVPVEYCHNT